MSNYETLKICKQIYETLGNLKDNCNYIYLGIEDSMDGIANMYQNDYEFIKKCKDNCKQLETNIKCPHCNNNLMISDIIKYAYVCEECDENFYYSECENGEDWWNKDDKDK